MYRKGGILYQHFLQIKETWNKETDIKNPSTSKSTTMNNNKVCIIL